MVPKTCSKLVKAPLRLSLTLLLEGIARLARCYSADTFFMLFNPLIALQYFKVALILSCNSLLKMIATCMPTSTVIRLDWIMFLKVEDIRLQRNRSQGVTFSSLFNDMIVLLFLCSNIYFIYLSNDFTFFSILLNIPNIKYHFLPSL